MKYTRLYTGTDGKSLFGEVELPTKEMPAYIKTGGPIARQTDTVGFFAIVKSAGIFFREWIPQSSYEWHTAPRRQFVIITEGGLEITAGDGTVRRFGPGEYLLVEDLTGGGHLTKLVANKIAKIIYVPL